MILDTNAVSAIILGEEAIADVLEDCGRHSLPVIALGEFRFGLLGSVNRRRYETMLAGLVRDSIVRRVDETTTVAYAAIRDELRVRGTPIPQNDLWIAALTRQYQEPLVSRDRHFDRVEGITRIGW